MTQLPVFPLDAVVFPGMTVPLNVFEERYKRLVRYCLEGERRFIIALSRASTGIGDGSPQLHRVGTFVEMLTVEEQLDGTFFLLAHGQGRCRFEIQREEAVPEPDGSLRPLWFVQVTPWPLERTDPNEERIAAWDALESFRAYADRYFADNVRSRLERSIPDDPLYQASFLCANVQVPLESRQVALEAPSLTARFRLTQRQIEELLENGAQASASADDDAAGPAQL